MSRAQVVRKIILPQAIVRMLPSFGSILSITIKDTAIATVIAVPELHAARPRPCRRRPTDPIEIFTSAMLVYFLILFPVTRGDRLGSTGASRIWGGHDATTGPSSGSTRDARWREGAARSPSLLTVLTMAIAVPGGIVLALMRLSPIAASVRRRRRPSSSSSATCR